MKLVNALPDIRGRRTSHVRGGVRGVLAGVSVAVLAVGVLVGPLSIQPAGATSSTTVYTCNGSSPSSITNNSYTQPGGCLLSPDHQYELIMQTDGNLVLYYMSQSDPLWDSGTAGKGADYATLQATGNLIVNSTAGLFWESGTSAPSASLVLQDDGNLVIYGTNGAGSPYAAWSTNTQDLRGYELQSGETLEPGQYLKSENGTWTLSMASPGYLVLSSTISSASPFACPIWSEPAIVNYDPYGGSYTPTITTYEPQNLSFSYTNKAPAEQPYVDGYVYSPPSGVTTATPTATPTSPCKATGTWCCTHPVVGRLSGPPGRTPAPVGTPSCRQTAMWWCTPAPVPLCGPRAPTTTVAARCARTRPCSKASSWASRATRASPA